MDLIRELDITCPYCWEVFSIVVELGTGDMEFIEDCQVCCHPIQFTVKEGNDGELAVNVDRA